MRVLFDALSCRGGRNDCSSAPRNQLQAWSLSTGKHRTTSQFKTNINRVVVIDSPNRLPSCQRAWHGRRSPFRGGCGPTKEILFKVELISRVQVDKSLGIVKNRCLSKSKQQITLKVKPYPAENRGQNFSIFPTSHLMNGQKAGCR